MSEIQQYAEPEHTLTIKSDSSTLGIIIEFCYEYIVAVQPVHFTVSIGNDINGMRITYRNIKPKDGAQEARRPEVDEFLGLVDLFQTKNPHIKLTIEHNPTEA